MQFPHDMFELGQPLTILLGVLCSGFGVAAVALIRKYLAPLLDIEQNRRYAEWIAKIADELTDCLVGKYPDNQWLRYLDVGVDQIAEICGISKDTAQRAISAAAGR